VRFAIWLAIGMIIYFAYSRRHSIIGQGLEKDALGGIRSERLK
jgi:basic amino acid/polyamine antiporter, APA family